MRAPSVRQQTLPLGMDTQDTAATGPSGDICGRVLTAETKQRRDGVLQLVGREVKIAMLDHEIAAAKKARRKHSHYEAEKQAITHGVLGVE